MLLDALADFHIAILLHLIGKHVGCGGRGILVLLNLLIKPTTNGGFVHAELLTDRSGGPAGLLQFTSNSDVVMTNIGVSIALAGPKLVQCQVVRFSNLLVGPSGPLKGIVV